MPNLGVANFICGIIAAFVTLLIWTTTSLEDLCEKLIGQPRKHSRLAPEDKHSIERLEQLRSVTLAVLSDPIITDWNREERENLSNLSGHAELMLAVLENVTEKRLDPVKKQAVLHVSQGLDAELANVLRCSNGQVASMRHHPAEEVEVGPFPVTQQT